MSISINGSMNITGDKNEANYIYHGINIFFVHSVLLFSYLHRNGERAFEVLHSQRVGDRHAVLGVWNDCKDAVDWILYVFACWNIIHVVVWLI